MNVSETAELVLKKLRRKILIFHEISVVMKKMVVFFANSTVNLMFSEGCYVYLPLSEICLYCAGLSNSAPLGSISILRDQEG